MTTFNTAISANESVRNIAPGGTAQAKRDYVNDIVARCVDPVEVRAADWEKYSAVFKRRGAMTLAHAASTPWQITNVRRVQTAPQDGKIVVNVCVQGELLVEQEGRSVVLKAGEAAVIDTLRMARVGAQSTVSHICLTLDRLDLGGAIVALDRPLVKIQGVGPIPQMTLDMILGTWKALGQVDTNQHGGLCRRLGSLIGESLVAPLSADAMSSTHLMAMVHRAKKIVAARSGERSFGAPQLAAAMGVSPRYLAVMFRRIADTPSDYIGRIRMHTAWDMLTTNGCDLSITEIGERVGVGSGSQFTKAVKASFQMTPKDIRRLRMS